MSDPNPSSQQLDQIRQFAGVVAAGPVDFGRLTDQSKADAIASARPAEQASVRECLAHLPAGDWTAVTVIDDAAVDGDQVAIVDAACGTQTIELDHTPKTVVVRAGAPLKLMATVDGGGGGVTAGVAWNGQWAPVRPLNEGETFVINVR